MGAGPEQLERARRRLQQQPAAVSGQGGHSACYRAACSLAWYGLDERQIYELLLSDYNPRCTPPWTRRELQHKARDACRALRR